VVSTAPGLLAALTGITASLGITASTEIAASTGTPGIPVLLGIPTLPSRHLLRWYVPATGYVTGQKPSITNNAGSAHV
jgi:hypothetical protein